MNRTIIIIPSRMAASRLKGKPLLKIKKIPIICHVLNRAHETGIESIVATEDIEILTTVKKNGGKAILTKENHLSGSDRVYEAYTKELGNNVDLIINLQGDMPNIKPNSISKLEKLMRINKCDIGTLASHIGNNDIADPNIVKVEIDEMLKDNDFLHAKDFFRTKKVFNDKKIYHHIGIYAFTNIALTKYVKLARSKLEIERNLEQMRALENNLIIKVGLSNSSPLGVDTKEDLEKISKEMKLS